MQVGWALYKYKALVTAFSRQCVTSRRFVDSTIIFLHLWPTFFIFIAPEYFLWSLIAGGGTPLSVFGSHWLILKQKWKAENMRLQVTLISFLLLGNHWTFLQRHFNKSYYKSYSTFKQKHNSTSTSWPWLRNTDPYHSLYRFMHWS